MLFIELAVLNTLYYKHFDVSASTKRIVMLTEGKHLAVSTMQHEEILHSARAALRMTIHERRTSLMEYRGKVLRMRGAIAEIVRAIEPYDALEQAHVAATIAWVDSGAPLYRVAKPATPPQHLVSYFALVDPTTDHLLLVDHKKAGLWLPGGGHVEPDEHPNATVRRELWEELRLPAQFLFPQPMFLTVTQTVGTTAGHTDVSLWYVLRGDSRQALQYDREEFLQIAWFPLERLPLERTDPHMQRFAAKLGHTLREE